ncbi:MAG: hypothetical protein ACK4V6_08725 [Microthrixaceae bacterium]
MTRVVAFIPDLMDRSRLGSRPVELVTSLEQLPSVAPGSSLVVVDLARPGALEAAASLVGSGARIVGFAPHVDDELRSSATESGVEVVTRSWFFGHLDDLIPRAEPAG